MDVKPVDAAPSRGPREGGLRDTAILVGSIALIIVGLVALNRIPYVGIAFTETLSWIWGLGAYLTIIIMRLTRDFARRNSVTWADVSTADAYAAVTFIVLTGISTFSAARADYNRATSGIIAFLLAALLAFIIRRFLPRWRAWHAGIRPTYYPNRGVNLAQAILAGPLASLVAIYDASVMLVAFSTYIGLMFAFPSTSQCLTPVILAGVLAIPLMIAIAMGRLTQVPWVKGDAPKN